MKSHAEVSHVPTRSLLMRSRRIIALANRIMFRGYAPIEPLALQIETTINCNLKCTMCERTYWPIRHHDDMTFEQFEKILDQFHDLTALSLTGIGEPLLNRDLTKMIAYAKSKGIFVTVTTNATLVNEKTAPEVIGSGLDELSFSMESADPTTFEKIRAGARFDRVLANVGTFMKVKDRMRSRTPEVVLRTVAMNHTVHEVPGLAKLAHELGIRHLKVAPLVFPYRPDLDDPGVDVARKIHGEAKALAKTLGIELEWDLIGRAQFRAGSCMVPYHTPYVFKEGYVAPCCLVTQRNARDWVIKNYTFGNVLDEGFAAIKNNRRFTEFRRRLLSSNATEIPEICKGCWMLFKD
jgi:MoaA/NifB/PqqE/SkfB family radical SAM enzyme